MTQHHSIRHMFSALLAALVLFACTGIQPDAARAAQSEKKLTVILYMCGSNLESDNGAATADITEILRSRYNSEAVNVIAMLGGTRKWWGGMDAQETAVYEISGNRPKQVWSDGLGVCPGSLESWRRPYGRCMLGRTVSVRQPDYGRTADCPG